MNKQLLSGLIGLVVGVVLTGLVMMSMAPSLMIIENKSKFGYEETIAKIKQGAAEKGWKTPATHEIHKAVRKAGFETKEVSVIELCHPEHAAKILKSDEDKVVTSMMPCRVSVYKNEKGEVIISRMNTSLVSQLFGGNVSSTMDLATKDTEEIYNSVL